jgi:homoserine dehydrogenase
MQKRINMIKIALIGLGTVGSSVVKILQDNKDLITSRCGSEIVPVIACVKNISKKRDVKIDIIDNIDNILKTKDIDIFVELMGGIDEPYEVAKKVLSNKQHLVTANKALLAYHRNELTKLSIKNNVIFEFEAAIGGGIPIVLALREGLSANNINDIKGILNGTCNYILTRMKNEKGLKYADVLDDAQKLGYAELDPALDVGGDDVAHKLLVLGSIAYGIDAKPEDILIEGITNITSDDIFFAKEFGYVLKLLAIAKKNKNEVELRVHPAFICKDSLLAKVDGVMNAISVDGDKVGETLYYGAGAGGDATASAVVANIIDIVKKGKQSNFAPLGFVNTNDKFSKSLKLAPKNKIKTKYYLRLKVQDKSGILATICKILSDENISIKNFFQKDSNEGETSTKLPTQTNTTAMIFLSTHICNESDIKTALNNLDKSNLLLDKVVLIRIED